MSDTIAALRAWVATKRKVASEATVTYGEHAVGYYDALGIVLAEIDRLWVAAEADRATPRRTVIAHNHGPHDGPGLSCREYPVGECQRVLDLDSPEAAERHRLAVLAWTGDPDTAREASNFILAALREQGR